MSGCLRLFICKRGKWDWEGALIVLAENEEEALRFYVEHETEHLEDEKYLQPTKIIEVPLDRKGIIYNDYPR